MLNHKPKRLFAFGDSFTEYVWLTWPQIVAYDLEIPMYNYGRPAAGNEYIFNTVIQAINYYDINQDDLVMICWSTVDRLDFRLRNGWNSIMWDDDKHPNPIKEIISFPEGQAVKQFAFIDALAKILLDRCQFHMFSINELNSLDFYNDADSKRINLDSEIDEIYQKTLSMIKPSFSNVLWNSNFDVKRNKDFQKLDSRSYVDLHPSPGEHLEYLNKIFPNYKFKQSTINKVNQVENIWIEYLKQNYPRFQNKQYKDYPDMLFPLTELTKIVYNQDIKLI